MIAPEPEHVSLLRVALAFSVVLGLLAGLALSLKYIGVRGLRLPGMPAQSSRMKVVETLPLDVRRRLVIVRCDGGEHLLLLGANNDIVVESDLGKNQPPSSQQNPL